MNANDTAKAASPASVSLDISSQVDHSEITIGDRIQYEIKVVYPADGHVELPSVLGNLGSFEVKEYQASDPKDAGNLKIQTWHFDLSTYTVGKYTIPPQLVVYRHGTDTTAATYYTQPIEINVIRTSPETVKDIADIATLAEVKSAQPWLAYGLGAAILIAAALLLWKRFRRKAPPKAAKPALPPFEEAMAKVAGLKDLSLIRQNRAREFCFHLSEALRRYLDRRYGTDSLESTTAEFLEKARSLPVTVAQKQWLGEFCEATDLIKFASAPLLESDAGVLIQKTEEFLRQTRPKETETGLPGQGAADAAKVSPKRPLTGKPAAAKPTPASPQPGKTGQTPQSNGKAAAGKPPGKPKIAPGPGYTQGGHGHEPESPRPGSQGPDGQKPGGKKPDDNSRGWTA
ncbi:MAG: hypothetical protein JWO30_1607 [Fibrobacteres bacterium]|nr:hypothetical protein [Fibrobacterota bacterium]